jgi:hypothetical protein
MNTRSFGRIVLPLSLVCLIALGAVSAVCALVGDITRDGHVGLDDLAVVVQALGSSEWAGGDRWNPAADLDYDDQVDVADLAIAGRSYGSDRVFHAPRRLSNAGDLVTTLDACVDGLDQLHVAWVEGYHDVYYTRLDRYGNTLIDDVLLDSGSSRGPAVAVGCDQQGTAHVIWDCVNEACQARFDAWGYPGKNGVRQPGHRL